MFKNNRTLDLPIFVKIVLQFRRQMIILLVVLRKERQKEGVETDSNNGLIY